MICSSECVLRRLELRIFTKKHINSLRKIIYKRPIYKACKYFDIWPYNGYISCEFGDLNEPIILSMKRDHFKALSKYLEFCNPLFTKDELKYIIYKCKQLNIEYWVLNGQIRFTNLHREVNKDVYLRHRDTPNS